MSLVWNVSYGALEWRFDTLAFMMRSCQNLAVHRTEGAADKVLGKTWHDFRSDWSLSCCAFMVHAWMGDEL